MADVFDLVGKISVEYSDAVSGLEKVKNAAKNADDSVEGMDTSAKNASDSVKGMGNAADDAGESVEDAGDSAQNADGKFSTWQMTLANIVSDTIEGLISKCEELAGKIVDLGVTAVTNYADYEQLVGGVETLFGDSSDTLIEYAENAYKTAGISSNDYMETATSFATSLIQGVGGDTDKAVELVNLAITDMADNANKMGTDIESIQNAYQGFAKQNYTMLDNLKLGYGGTQEEMIRLINDSGVLDETIGSLDDVTFDQMIEAIHAVQDNLGITGTTAAEAGDTLSGSWSSTQALFDNILTKVGSELAPVIMTFLQDLSEWLETIDWNEFSQSIGEAFEGLFTWLQEIDWETFFETAFEKMEEFIGWIGEIAESIPGIADSLSTIADVLETLSPLIAGLAAGIAAFKVISTIVTTVVPAITSFAASVSAAGGGIAGIVSVVTGLLSPVSAIAILIGSLVALGVSLYQNWDSIKEIAADVWSAITGFVSTAWEKIKEIFSAIGTWFGERWKDVKGVFAAIGEWFGEKFTEAWDAITGVFAAIGTWFDENVIQPIAAVVEPYIQVAIGLIEGVWEIIQTVFSIVATWFDENVIQPVSEFFTGMWNTISETATQLWEDIKGVFSAVATWFDENVIQPVTGAFSDAWETLSTGASDAWKAVKEVFSGVAKFFKETFNGAWEWVKGVFEKGGEIFEGIADSISSAFKSIVNYIIDGINSAIAIPFDKVNGLLNTLKDASFLGISPFSDKWDYDPLPVPQIPELAQGGILKKGQTGYLEGTGAEAVVPLEKNTEWTQRVAQLIDNEQSGHYASADAQVVSLLAQIVNMMGEKDEGESPINITVNVESMNGSKNDADALADLVAQKLYHTIYRKKVTI